MSGLLLVPIYALLFWRGATGEEERELLRRRSREVAPAPVRRRIAPAASAACPAAAPERGYLEGRPMIAAAAAAVGAALLALAGSPAGGSTVVQVDRTWTCTSRVDLDLVKVTMTRAVYGNRRLEDAVHLQPGCTGRIGRLEVVQYAADGVKVAGGVHDLTVGGGSIRCLAKAPTPAPGRDPGDGRQRASPSAASRSTAGARATG